MIFISGKCRERYLDHTKDISKNTCLIHGIRHSPYKCKVFGEFSFKCFKNRPPKYLWNCPATRLFLNKQQYNIAIVNNEEDEILLQENINVGAESEEHENIGSKINKNDLYHIENMIFDDKIERQNGISVHLKSKSKKNLIFKSRMVWII